MKAIIDADLINNTIGSKIGSYLEQLGVKYETKVQIKSNTIYWRRSTQQTFKTNENEVSLG